MCHSIFSVTTDIFIIFDKKIKRQGGAEKVQLIYAVLMAAGTFTVAGVGSAVIFRKIEIGRAHV